jgi:hypothetical protein
MAFLLKYWDSSLRKKLATLRGTVGFETEMRPAIVQECAVTQSALGVAKGLVAQEL